MRILSVLIALGLALVVWADGFTTYGASSFNSIWETDQLALIELTPARVTLDMYIAIDPYPQGQTITYILPFWQKPEGFSMTAESADDFREHSLEALQPLFHREIRRANRSACGELIDLYPKAALFAYAPLTPIGLLGSLLFTTFGKNGDAFTPYSRVTLPAVLLSCTTFQRSRPGGAGGQGRSFRALCFSAAALSYLLLRHHAFTWSPAGQERRYGYPTGRAFSFLSPNRRAIV